MPDTSTTPVDTCCDRHHYSCHLGEDGPPIYCCGACPARSKLNSRASIGPDSERIRELDEDVERALRAADAGNAGHWPTVAAVLADEVRRLRAAGLLPGPDDIVVSREALAHVAGVAARSDHCYCELCLTVYDALHPAQEQQT